MDSEVTVKDRGHSNGRRYRSNSRRSGTSLFTANRDANSQFGKLGIAVVVFDLSLSCFRRL